MAKEVPFCPCEVCTWLSESDPEHVVREASHVIVLPEDTEHEIAGMAVCDEHFIDYKRAHRSAQSPMEAVH